MIQSGQRNVKPSATVRQPALNVTHAIYDTAIGEELVQANPVVGVQRPKVQRRRWRVLEPVEVARVLKAFEDDRARTVFLTLTLTGLRRFELQALRWKHINLLDATVRVEESKSEEGERLIALAPGLAAALENRYAITKYKTDEDYVFGHPERGRSSTTSGTQASSEGAGDGRDHRLRRPFHDARHGALTNLAAAGVYRWRSWASPDIVDGDDAGQYVHLAGVVFRDEAACSSNGCSG